MSKCGRKAAPELGDTQQRKLRVNFTPIKTTAHSFSHSKLDGQTLEFVKEVHYLGHIVNDKLQDEADLGRELCKAYKNKYSNNMAI